MHNATPFVASILCALLCGVPCIWNVLKNAIHWRCAFYSQAPYSVQNPLPIFQITIATLVSWQVNLQGKYGIDVVGEIPSGWETKFLIHVTISGGVFFFFFSSLSFIEQPPAACFPAHLALRSGDWGRLRPVCGWLRHRYFTGKDLCTEIWI